MGAIAVPLRIRLPPGGRNRAPAAQLVASEDAEDDAEGREDEEEEDRQKKETVHRPEDVGQLHPGPMGRREKRRRRGGKDQKDDARNAEDEPRQHPSLPEEQEGSEEGEEASDDEAELAVFLHPSIVAGSPFRTRAQGFAARCLEPGAVSGAPFAQSGQAAGSQAGTSSERSAR